MVDIIACCYGSDGGEACSEEGVFAPFGALLQFVGGVVGFVVREVGFGEFGVVPAYRAAGAHLGFAARRGGEGGVVRVAARRRVVAVVAHEAIWYR